MSNDDRVPPLRGLVLAGGKSSRMGRDKASIVVEGRKVPQHRFLYEELHAVCGSAYLSGRGRRQEHAWPDLPRIEDSYPEIGPMAGVLSAFGVNGDCAWLVVAVDLLNITRTELAALAAERDPDAAATTFFSDELGSAEPLLAIYEPRSLPHLLARYGEGSYSLKHALNEITVRSIYPHSQSVLANANTEPDLETRR